MNRITMTMSTPVAWPTDGLPDIDDAVWATDDHELGGVAETSIEDADDDPGDRSPITTHTEGGLR
jgi:hypothetical protein